MDNIRVCAGLDVHEETIVACLRVRAPRGPKVKRETRSFSAFADGLQALREWLMAAKCERCAMESTGVYWMPVYEVLEDSGIELFVGNAAHLKAVPGRKTDVKDAEWIADLAAMGLIRKSYVPTAEVRELRKLMRYRRGVVRERATMCNRIIKQLELSGIKLAAVASNVLGKTGRRIIDALAKGRATPQQMAELAVGALRKKMADLARAVSVELDEDSRWILGRQLERLGEIDREVEAIEARIDAKLKPHQELRTLLTTIPGVSDIVAAVLIAEIGPTVDAFRSEHALANWAGLCPGNNESAGKRKRAPHGSGNEYLRSTLVDAAHAAVRKKHSYYKAKFHKLMARRGYKRAVFAIAHKILRAVYHIINKRVAFQDLGELYLDKLDTRRTARRALQTLRALGFEVVISRQPEGVAG